ncbi:MAG: REP-associated tyrosine transposase [Candidatus Anammoxibacter sp.]
METNDKEKLKHGGTGFQPVKSFKIYKRNLPHWEQPGSVYFITFRTANNFILPNTAKEIVFDTITFHNNKKYRLYTFVIMTNHIHLILQPLEKIKDAFYSVAEIMHSIKSYSSNEINKVLKRKCSVWLAENFDRIVRNEKELSEKINYIANNPIKLQLVDEYKDYKWLYVEGWEDECTGWKPVLLRDQT